MSIIIVVPCYNEASRLDLSHFSDVGSGVVLLFVDDGSTDQTLALLHNIAGSRGHRVHSLTNNVGKGEAVRTGLRLALNEQAEYVGYWDADGATRFGAISEFVNAMRADPELEVLMGSRVRMLGWRVQRRSTRHYPGRIIATLISWLLRLPVYDTQCGAKLLRNTPALQAALSSPFESRWLFDVELIARLQQESGWSALETERRINEVPLRAWRDVGESRINTADLLRLPFDLLRLWRRYR